LRCAEHRNGEEIRSRIERKWAYSVALTAKLVATVSSVWPSASARGPPRRRGCPLRRAIFDDHRLAEISAQLFAHQAASTSSEPPAPNGTMSFNGWVG
jgi:hypothetical protein